MHFTPNIYRVHIGSPLTNFIICVIYELVANVYQSIHIYIEHIQFISYIYIYLIDIHTLNGFGVVRQLWLLLLLILLLFENILYARLTLLDT